MGPAEMASRVPSGEMPWSLLIPVTGSVGTRCGSPPVTGSFQSCPSEFSSRKRPSRDQLGASKCLGVDKITFLVLPSALAMVTWLNKIARLGGHPVRVLPLPLHIAADRVGQRHADR